ncbi:acyl-CoA dehydrogenase family protein [Streptomyces prasinopilosus]|uniref:Acyl-CoA dehydrogenase n=1 Tax=Streptomyces prasinopilosus TaxID=67344 RepID=A0A1G6M3W6_9ACTN|nr:acyl-CoA dehydrogenase [Streptomyces prasinopilosus]SDC50131.1 Acyl-CoA dehydrogenase [Streptomyces prasinopilosus]
MNLPHDTDERLAALRRQAAEWAGELRSHALTWEQTQRSAHTTVTRPPELALLTALSDLSLPERYDKPAVEAYGHRFTTTNALERAVLTEEAAYGDAALLLAAPGALTAGPVVEALGSTDQQDWFYGRLAGRTGWTCLAMTEAGHGSDAAGMRSALTRPERDDRTDACEDHVLTGAKTYIGNAARAHTAVVFARTGDGPLDLRAVLLDLRAPGVTAAPLPTIGLAGALGTLGLDAVEVGADGLLGRHLPPIKRGMWGWLRAFNLLRTSAAAMGVGIARAAHDYVRHHRTTLRAEDRARLDGISRRTAAVRELTYRAVGEIEAHPDRGHLPSVAKVSAARLAERTTREALRFFGHGARLDHPLLDKWARDARGVEYLEGTSDIQRLQIYNTLARSGPAPAPPTGPGE